MPLGLVKQEMRCTPSDEPAYKNKQTALTLTGN